MKLFSQRHGLKPVRSIIQKDSMDDALRNKLWSALVIFIWEPYEETQREVSIHQVMTVFLSRLWMNYFEKPVDTLVVGWPQNREVIRTYFFKCQWNEVYDFIEFVSKEYGDRGQVGVFIHACNMTLEQELSAYRFVGTEIAPITSEEEIAAIERAIDVGGPLSPVSTHLRRALELLSDRQSPDYRNSMKESISAVESICRLIANDPKAELGKALKAIESQSQVELHPALQTAFEKLYGYTSDADGIRHALLDKPDLELADARFMLISCSAFINYLIEKAAKAGIDFKSG